MRFPVIILATATLMAGCGQQNTDHENLNAQYNADSQAEYEKQQPADAVWTGKVHLIQSDQDFDATLSIHREWVNSHVSGSPDPTSTTELPTLKGNLDFAVLDEKDIASDDLSNLRMPLGQGDSAQFDFGNYSDKTQVMVLPYSVAHYALGTFGSLSGKITGNHYQGTWYANYIQGGKVGTFDFVKAASQ
jgi:hypothetical protein